LVFRARVVTAPGVTARFRSARSSRRALTPAPSPPGNWNGCR
jgi:hypothetical protein